MRRIPIALAGLVVFAMSAPAAAQSHGHAGHGSGQPSPPPSPPASSTGAQVDHSAHQKPAPSARPAGIPELSDEDRAAAFPQLDQAQHTTHDASVHWFVLADQLEWQAGDPAGVSWDSSGWIGGDLNRFWFRTEGEAEHDELEAAQAHALYGRAFARWWDLVVGIRQDFEPGPSRTWAAVGVQGLAPYWFEIEATAYLGEAGRTHFRVETEYELLLTNRLILQPLVELELYGKSDPERGIGAGLSSVEAGLRLRYEIRRELAPYVGVTWDRRLFGTADRAREAGEEPGRARLVAGARVWF